MIIVDLLFNLRNLEFHEVEVCYWWMGFVCCSYAFYQHMRRLSLFSLLIGIIICYRLFVCRWFR